MNILSLLEMIAGLPAVQQPVAQAVANEVMKLVTDTQGKADVASFLSLLATLIK